LAEPAAGDDRDRSLTRLSARLGSTTGFDELDHFDESDQREEMT
jgi:hypothetical protein